MPKLFSNATMLLSLESILSKRFEKFVKSRYREILFTSDAEGKTQHVLLYRERADMPWTLQCSPFKTIMPLSEKVREYFHSEADRFFRTLDNIHDDTTREFTRKTLLRLYPTTPVLRTVRLQSLRDLENIVERWYPHCMCAVVPVRLLRRAGDTEPEQAKIPAAKRAFSTLWASRADAVFVDDVTYEWLGLVGILPEVVPPSASYSLFENVGDADDGQESKNRDKARTWIQHAHSVRWARPRTLPPAVNMGIAEKDMEKRHLHVRKVPETAAGIGREVPETAARVGRTHACYPYTDVYEFRLC